MDVIGVLDEPGGVNAGSPAHIQLTSGRVWQVATQDLLGPHQLQLTESGGDALLFPDGLVVSEDCFGVFHAGNDMTGARLVPRVIGSRGIVLFF